MSTIPFSEARAHLTDVANAVAYKGKRVVVTRNDRELIAIVSIEDLQLLEALEDAVDLEDAKKALREIEKHGTISWAKAKRELDL